MSEAAMISAQGLGCDITVVAAGWTDQIATEDIYAARALGRRLVDMGALPHEANGLPSALDEDAAAIFAQSDSGKCLANLGYQEDVAYCARSDVLNVAPIHDGEGFVPFDPG